MTDNFVLPVPVLHSFAHLSESKADPEFTKALFDRVEERMSNAGYVVHQTPFGYFLDLRLEAPGLQFGHRYGYSETEPGFLGKKFNVLFLVELIQMGRPAQRILSSGHLLHNTKAQYFSPKRPAIDASVKNGFK